MRFVAMMCACTVLAWSAACATNSGAASDAGSGFAPDGLSAYESTEWYLMQGHRAFGEGRYDEAKQYYEKAKSSGSSWAQLPELLGLLERRRALGTIHPVSTFHIGIIYVRTIRAVDAAGNVSERADVTDEQIQKWRVYFPLARAIYEAFSGGNWTFSFEEVDAQSDWSEETGLHPHNPDHLDLERYFLESSTRVDSYVTLSNTVSPAKGLARRYPYVHGVAYSPHRGMSAVNAGSHGFGILVHELYHTVEWGASLGPAHGFHDDVRAAFPDWKGATEWDFYAWRLSTAMAADDWHKFEFTRRFRPYSPITVDLQRKVMAAYSGIPLIARIRARELAVEAEEKKGEEMAKDAEKALSLSPYEPRALRLIVPYLRKEDPGSPKLKDYRRRLSDVRLLHEFWDSAQANDEMNALGEVAGAWWPEDLETEPVAVEWDISESVTAAGTIDASFYYLRGGRQLEIHSAQLLENGRVVATDEHVSRSGSRVKDGITYSFTLKNRRADARYTLRATVLGVDGHESYGVVLVRRR
jgi:hypothetical protein